MPCNNPELNELYSNQLMLPCTYADYKKAMLLFYERNNISAIKDIFMEQFADAVKRYF